MHRRNNLSTIDATQKVSPEEQLWHEAKVLKPFTPAYKNVLFQVLVTLHSLALHLGLILFVNLSGGTIPQEVNLFMITVAGMFFGWNLYLLFTGALRKAVVGTVLLSHLGDALKVRFAHTQIIAKNQTKKVGIIIDSLVVGVFAVAANLNPDLTFIPILGVVFTSLGVIAGFLNFIGNSFFIKSYELGREQLLVKYSQDELVAIAKKRKVEVDGWYDTAVTSFQSTLAIVRNSEEAKKAEEKELIDS